MRDLLNPAKMVAAVVYSAIGLTVFFMAFVVFDKVTPYDLWQEIVQKQNRALAILIAVVIAVGTLVGLEIPLLIRILKSRLEFKDLVARVLSLDYLGALGASLLFPLFLVPKLGLLNTSLMFGTANVCVALWTLHIF